MKTATIDVPKTGPVIGKHEGEPIHEWVETREHGRFRYFGVASDAAYDTLRKKHGEGARLLAVGEQLYLNVEDERRVVAQVNELRMEQREQVKENETMALPWPISAFFPATVLSFPPAMSEKFWNKPWMYITRNAVLLVTLLMAEQYAKGIGMIGLYFSLMTLSGVIAGAAGVMYALIDD